MTAQACQVNEWSILSHLWMSHRNVSCHTLEWIISHVGMSPQPESFNKHKCPWVMSDMYISVNEACHTLEWVRVVRTHRYFTNYGMFKWSVPYICISHITLWKESCYVWMMNCVPHWSQSWHTLEWAESCHKLEWVMQHKWMRLITGMYDSYHTHVRDRHLRVGTWVLCHVWMSHGTHINESCHTLVRDRCFKGQSTKCRFCRIRHVTCTSEHIAHWLMFLELLHKK